MKSWKLMGGICVAMVVFTLIISLICRSTYTNSGLGDINSVSEYLEYVNKIPVNAIDAPVNTENVEEQIRENRNYYITAVSQQGGYVHHDLKVLIVQVNDDSFLYQKINMLVQTAKVIKVLQGEAIEGEYVDIYSMLGISFSNNGEVINYGVSSKNIMLPGNQYLVFCEEVENMEELADYEGNIYKYRQIYALYNQLNITRDMTSLLADTPNQTDWHDVEFFVYNQETLNALLDIKHEILSQYGIAVGDNY